MEIEVCRVGRDGVERVRLQMPAGACVAEAVALSGLQPADGLEPPPATDTAGDYAVFGQRATLATVLEDGDRVELLRPLKADPKEARRRRVEKRRGQATGE